MLVCDCSSLMYVLIVVVTGVLSPVNEHGTSTAHTYSDDHASSDYDVIAIHAHAQRAPLSHACFPNLALEREKEKRETPLSLLLSDDLTVHWFVRQCQFPTFFNGHAKNTEHLTGCKRCWH
eukprot:scpid104636/ scgid28954/ 